MNAALAPTLRRRAAAVVRAARRATVRSLRSRAALRPPGDPWAFRLEVAARHVGRRLRRLETRLLPPTPRAADATSLAGVRLVRVGEPLVLIGQVGRSGGTLLLRLFDGHGECLVVPHELGTMVPATELVHDPAGAFDRLTPAILAVWHDRGVRIGKASLGRAQRREVPFDLAPSVLRRLFEDAIRAAPPRTDRELLDAYLSAYFSAWRDRRPPSGAPRWVVGFEPGAVGDDARMRRFDANYPDGRVIAVVRDPWTWFASARRWSLRFAHPDVALSRWRWTTERSLAYRERFPERIHLVAFDDLILRTRETVEGICRFLELGFDESLLTPTFNGAPADDNSSFGGKAGGVSGEPATGRRSLLTEEESALVDARAGETWRRAVAVIGRGVEP